MENFFEISVNHGEQLREFIVKNYDTQEEGKCKFEVFRLGKSILSLEQAGITFKPVRTPTNSMKN
jgi:hypothetical protein